MGHPHKRRFWACALAPLFPHVFGKARLPSTPVAPTQSTPTPPDEFVPRGTPTPAGRAARPSPIDIERSHRESRVFTWLLLLIGLAAAAPGMLVDLHRPEVVRRDEARTLATSFETWRSWSQRGLEGAMGVERFVPTLNGQPQLRDPPGTTWLHLAVLWPASGKGGSLDPLILRARLLTACMGLLTVAAVYWAGLSIGGMWSGFYAALLCTSAPLLVYQARWATPVVPSAAWAYLSLAAALWAARPLRPVPSVWRQAIGWATCGAAMGAAALTAGPLQLAATAVVVLLIILLCPHRTSHLLGLLAAVLIGLLLVLPWAVYVHNHDPQAGASWFRQVVSPGRWGWGRSPAEIQQGGLALLLAMWPWGIWLVGAATHTVLGGADGARTRMLIGWTVLAVGTAVLALCSPAAKPEDTVTLVPAMSILLGHLFHRYALWAQEGRSAQSWRILFWPHEAVLSVLSVLVPLAIRLQSWFVAQGVLTQPLTMVVSWPVAIGFAAILLGLVGFSLRWYWKDYPSRVVMCWAAWGVVLVTVLLIPVSRSPQMRSPARVDTLTLAAIAGDQPVYWMASSGDPGEIPDPAVLLYWTKPLPVIDAGLLKAAVERHEAFYVVAPLEGAVGSVSGAVFVAELPSLGRKVWKFTDSGSSGEDWPPTTSW